MPIPAEISGQRYIALATFRKTGVPVWTPIWFGEQNGKLHVMTHPDSGKSKRLRNNSAVRVAACTVRGRITGPEFSATARLLPPESWPQARQTIRKKYWLARLPIWSRQNVYLEIDVNG
jgi:uncharacterized protein